MAAILNNLKRLNLAPQPVLGDQTNIQDAIRKMQKDAKVDSHQSGEGAVGALGNPLVITISSEDENPAPPRYQAPKALRLNQLADKASNAADNKSLSALVKEFLQILQMNSSKTLTKEAFYFLDVLHKQLDDPSVFIKPQRCVQDIFTFS